MVLSHSRTRLAAFARAVDRLGDEAKDVVSIEFGPRRKEAP